MSRTSVAALGMHTHTHIPDQPKCVFRIRRCNYEYVREKETWTQHYLLNVWQGTKERMDLREAKREKEREQRARRKEENYRQWQDRLDYAMYLVRWAYALWTASHAGHVYARCMQGPKGWLKPLLLRRIMTTKLLHVISLNEQSTRYNTLASSLWHIARTRLELWIEERITKNGNHSAKYHDEQK